MTFRDYWLGLKPGTDRETFAKACGSSVGYFNLLASNHAKAGPDLAIRIEAASGGAVTVESIRPDVPWHVIRNAPAPTAEDA